MFSFSTWLKLSLPGPIGWITERQKIIAVNCRYFPFCPGSQSPPAIWCPMEIPTVIYRMVVWPCGRMKDVDCQLQKRALRHDPLPWHIASFPVHTSGQIVNAQQAQHFRSTLNLLQMRRLSIACMLSTSAHSPLPAPVWGPLRKVSTHMENHG